MYFIPTNINCLILQLNEFYLVKYKNVHMKNTLKYISFSFVFLFLGSNFYSQSNNETIRWSIYNLEGKGFLIPNNQYEWSKLPQIHTKIKLSSNYKDIAPQINIIESEVLTSKEKECFNVKSFTLNTSIALKTTYAFQVKKKYAWIDFTPLYIKNGKIHKVTKYNLSFTEIPSQNRLSVSRAGSYKTSSVLANGDIFKFAVKTNGIYRLSYSDLVSDKVLSAPVNSSNLNIYSNSIGMLPEVINSEKHDDLEKCAIKIVDGSDGVFGNGDYILFYAQGPDRWKMEDDTTGFYFVKHLYSKNSYYFLKINDNSGAKRITDIASSTIHAGFTISTFNDYKVKEDEFTNLMQKYNKGGSGKEWIGDIFDVSLTRTYNFSFPNISTASDVRVKTATMSNSTVGSSFSLNFGNGLATGIINTSGISQSTHAQIARKGFNTTSFTPNSSSIPVKLTYNKPAVGGVGYLDRIELNVKRNLKMHGNQMEFRDLNSLGVGNVAKYSVNATVSVSGIWDVTNPQNVQNTLFSTVGSQKEFTFKSDSLRTFIAFRNSFLSPSFVEKVANQNLHGASVPDMLIVYHPLFSSQVSQLENFHKSNGLTVVKATVQEIYNEFSSGAQDITAIKSFAKMFYEKGGVAPPKYLLLFGDGSFDYKNRISPNDNFVPVWESWNTLSDVTSYTSDDFYATLDDGEILTSYALMDIAVGRLPVKTAQEAQNVVNKIINYQKQNVPISQASNCNSVNSGSAYGDWRNKITLISDDVDENWEAAFFFHTERIMDSITKNYPTYNLTKIHMDSYKQTSTPGGERYVGGADALRRAVQNGSLITAYEGHGGEIGLASERILDLSTINGWTNFNKLTVLLTATCEFTKYDDPSRTSAGEQALLNPNGAAIALFTTTRPVYQNVNENLIELFFQEIFVKKTDGTPRTLGEVYMETKNRINGALRFGLIGDPALNIAFPKNKVITTHVNNTVISSTTDTLKALSKITIKGFVADASGSKITNYNGVVFPTVYDKPKNISTLGNKSPIYVYNFEVQNSILYKGKVSVKNGDFEFTFIVPKDINYQFGKGKLSYYAYNGKEDATGYSKEITIGGKDNNAGLDEKGPEIGLYLNSKSFVSGGITSENPVIYAEIFDSNGINTTGNGIGHNITAIIDKNTSKAINLNNYYEADMDSYSSGKVNYPLSDLAIGNHTLSLKAWDVHNNSSEKIIDFVVVKDEKIAIDHVLNYPNPFTTRTQFFFEHNKACEFLEVQIQIFTISGKLVKSMNQMVKTHGFRTDAIEWDGKDDYGDNIGRGTYVYRVKVTDDEGNKVEKIEKLVILK